MEGLREGLTPFPENLNSLNDCCYNKTCLGGFQTLPERLFDFTVTFPKPLLESKNKYCGECGLPDRQKISNDELDDATDDHCNIAMDNGFKGFYPHHTFTCLVYYKICNRMFQRVNRNQACRRNVINIIIYLPYRNCFIPYHMTWRYAPHIIGVEPLLRRILRETVAKFMEAMEEIYPEYFCTCYI